MLHLLTIMLLFTLLFEGYKKKFEDIKRVLRSRKMRRRTDNIMVKSKRPIGKTFTKTHRKPKIHPHQPRKVNSGIVSNSCSTSITVKRQQHYVIWKSCWTQVEVYKYISNMKPLITKLMGVKTNQTSFLRGIRSGQHSTELKAWKHEQNY
jgi:hypothetical protein